MSASTRALVFVLAGVLLGAPARAQRLSPPLQLPEVLESVRNQYPPQLAAMIEQDIANGRVRQAQGSFDLNLNAGGASNLAGFYDGRSGYANLEKPLPFWGGNVYGGYRLSSGYLPNYNKDRTSMDGEAVLGFRIPILRDGTIDRRRASLWQAQIDRELADPFILRQYLDFVRAASVAYYGWVAAGQRVLLTEELMRIAKDRDSAIAEQVRSGASAPIVQVDNQRLVVSRQIAVVQAVRRLEAAAIELSLFLRRKENGEPILLRRDRVPPAFPEHPRPDLDRLSADIDKALAARPEMRRIDLTMRKTDIDRRLAKNNLLPSLEAGVQARQTLGGKLAKETENTEVEAKVEFKLPLERREAKGRVETAEAQLRRLELERKFASDRISADVRDSYSALAAAFDVLKQTSRNVELASQLEAAENEKVRQGAADLLALQIREQATFDARVLEVEALADYFRAQANYRAAVAADAPALKAAPLLKAAPNPK